MKPEINNDELTAVKEVLNTGYLTEGPVTKEFEQAVATYVGTRYAVATTSCTTALQLVLETLDFGALDFEATFGVLVLRLVFLVLDTFAAGMFYNYIL